MLMARPVSAWTEYRLFRLVATSLLQHLVSHLYSASGDNVLSITTRENIAYSNAPTVEETIRPKPKFEWPGYGCDNLYRDSATTTITQTVRQCKLRQDPNVIRAQIWNGKVIRICMLIPESGSLFISLTFVE